MTFPKGLIKWEPGELEEYRKLAEGGESMRRLAVRKGITHVSMRAAITGVPARQRRGTRHVLTNEQRESARKAIAAGDDLQSVADRYGRSWAWAYWISS